jgi:hypothetical protein
MATLKYLCLLFILGLSSQHLSAQSPAQNELLDQFIRMHNAGTESAIRTFIQETYHPALLPDLAMDKHVAFYQHIIDEFGPLNTEVYKVADVKPTKLVVHLIKEGESVINLHVDPAEILEVELDTDPNLPNRLSRGLGLGALVCARPEE